MRVFNGNHILNNDAYHKFEEYHTEHRYQMTKTIGSIQRDWCSKYEIKPQNVLIFCGMSYISSTWKRMNMENIMDRCLQKHNSVDYSEYYKSKYLILDKNKVVAHCKSEHKISKYNDNKHGQMNGCMILQYFNIWTQTMQVIQYVLIRHRYVSHNKVKAEEIRKYIENEYILLDDVDNEWYDELKRELDKMGTDYNEPKLSIYNVRYDGKYHEIGDGNIDDSNEYGFIFQLNTRHKAFRNGIFAQRLRETQKNLKIKNQNFVLHLNNLESLKSQFVKICMRENKDLLGQYIARYHQKNLQMDEKVIFEYDIESIMDKINMSEIDIKIQLFEPIVITLQKKISKMYGNIIEPEKFEFTNNSNKFLTKQSKLSTIINHSIANVNCHIIWDMPISTPSNVLPTQKTLYHVKLFDLGDFPLPLQFYDNPTKSIKFWYHSKFKVSQFIHDLFHSIQSQQNQNHCLMDDSARTLFNTYFNASGDEDEDEDMIELNKNRNTKCMLSMWPIERNMRWEIHSPIRKLKAFRSSAEFNPDGLDVSLSRLPYACKKDEMVQLSLYIFRVNSPQENRNIKVNIKFVYGYDRKVVGFPAYIWINKQDTLEYVVNRYLQKIRKFIIGAYKVKDNRNTMIKRDRWNGYKLNQRMDLDKDVLLFKLRKMTEYDAYYVEFDNDLYTNFNNYIA